jgi:hypothetical protein
MTTRRWMVLVAVAALDCAGLFAGPDWLMVTCVVLTAGAPVVVPILVLAHMLGPDVLGR